MQGAKIGGQVGGGYGAIVGAVIGFVVGATNDPDKHQKRMTDEFNRQVTTNVARSLFDLERQRVSERMRTTSAMLGYNAQRSTTLSTLRSQYGATDVIGSSSNALKQAYEFQLDQAIAQENFNFEVGIDNYNTEILQVVNRGLGQLRYDFKPQGQQSMSPDDVSSMVQKGMAMYGKYGNKGASGSGSWTGWANLGTQGYSTNNGMTGGYSSGTPLTMNTNNLWSSSSGSLGISA